MNSSASTSHTVPYKLIQINADTLTPISIFQRLKGTKKFLLESSFQHEAKGKYSYIGLNPYQEIIGYRNQTFLIDHQSGTKTPIKQNALTYIRDHLPNMKLDLPLPFTGGAVGYVAYDAIRQFANIGPELEDDLQMPDIHLMVYKQLIIFEHVNETVHLLAINVDHESEEKLEQSLKKLKQALQENIMMTDLEDTPIQFDPDISAEGFQNKVKLAKHYIEQGEALQIVLSQRMKTPFHGDPLTFYRKLRRANPSPYMFYIDFEDYKIIGASPESLIQTTGDHIVTNPIAGTRPRGKNAEEDQLLEKELLADRKEITEHHMLVELSQDDLKRVCHEQDISVPVYMKVEKYQHVMHIVSEVHGKLKPGLSSIDALIACLPAGTVSGAPKIRAMQIINELEEKKRGVYAGGIGYIGFNRNLNMAIAIRSLIVKDGYAYLQAGAGIVADSVAENEYMETLHKARSLMDIK